MNVNQINEKDFVPVAAFASPPEFSVVGESYIASVKMYDSDKRYLGTIKNGINETEYNLCIGDSAYAQQYIYSRLAISPTGDITTIEE